MGMQMTITKLTLNQPTFSVNFVRKPVSFPKKTVEKQSQKTYGIIWLNIGARIMLNWNKIHFATHSLMNLGELL